MDPEVPGTLILDLHTIDLCVCVCVLLLPSAALITLTHGWGLEEAGPTLEPRLRPPGYQISTPNTLSEDFLHSESSFNETSFTFETTFTVWGFLYAFGPDIYSIP